LLQNLVLIRTHVLFLDNHVLNVLIQLHFLVNCYRIKQLDLVPAKVDSFNLLEHSCEFRDETNAIIDLVILHVKVETAQLLHESLAGPIRACITTLIALTLNVVFLLRSRAYRLLGHFAI